MPTSSISHIHIKRIQNDSSSSTNDVLAVEEPLEIRISYLLNSNEINKNISITMRTPGNDEELAIGFLFTEGIISKAADIAAIKNLNADNENIIQVILASGVNPDMAKLDRHFYTTSSCGVCGKSSIDAVRTVCNLPATKDNIQLPASFFYALPTLLRAQQQVFESTGGLHASALFNEKSELLLMREDVGRHNALDKVIGAALMQGMLPLNSHVLLLSGRASFELIQKAMMAGIKVVAAVGAPSSLAVQLAEENGMTLIGFLRADRFNIYSGAQRVLI